MRPQTKEEGRRQCSHTREHTVMGTEGPRAWEGPVMWCPRRPVVQTSTTPRSAAFSVCGRETSTTNTGGCSLTPEHTADSAQWR